MPCIHMQDGDRFQWGLWQITETADFFNQRINYRSPASKPQMQIQQMASRMQLNELAAGFPFDAIVLTESGKPILPQGDKNFSLSHTKGYAAAIISEQSPVGIDVELISARVLKVEHKFLNEQELSMLSCFDSSDRVKYATLCWSIKETVFKCLGEGGIDFAAHINIADIPQADTGNARIHFLKTELKELTVGYMLFNDLWLTYMMDAR